MPLDISGEYLLSSARRLADEYPWLRIHAACVDFSHTLALPQDLPKTRKVAFFPGSSLGNFDPAHALGFLREIREMVGPGGGLLIGADTKKDREVLDAA